MIPSGSYGAILADPPWRFSTWSAKGRGRSPDGKSTHQGKAARHYETMPLDAIMALPIETAAAKDCALFLWTVDSMLPQALAVGEAWGFAYKTVAFVWAKERDTSMARLLAEPNQRRFPIGTGYWTRANPELCLLFTRGRPRRVSAAVRKLVIAPRREHSRKPDEIRGHIEQLVAGPYLELFARSRAPGWDAWGDQTDRFPPAPTIVAQERRPDA
jgi:N6-adenosine-specific RNA methylase IME4